MADTTYDVGAEPREARRLILLGMIISEAKRLGLDRNDVDWVCCRVKEISPHLWELAFGKGRNV